MSDNMSYFEKLSGDELNQLADSCSTSVEIMQALCEMTPTKKDMLSCWGCPDDVEKAVAMDRAWELAGDSKIKLSWGFKTMARQAPILKQTGEIL